MRDKKNTVCACGATFPQNPPGYCGAAGYAVLPDGNRICYACADKRQVEDLKDRSKPFVGYLADYSITTLTGGHLMRVLQSWSCRLAQWSYWHGSTIQAVRAVDVHGGRWYGRGSKGVAIVMRPCRGGAK